MLTVHDTMGMIKCSACSIVKVRGFNRERETDGLNPPQCPSIGTLVTLGWKGAEVVTAVFPS